MKTLYLRNVPDEVVARLERMAEARRTSVSAVAIHELAEVSRRVDNPGLLAGLPDLSVRTTDIARELNAERADR